ncbi:hypothetical protein [Bacillus wiedmannii]|uniref:hypothetical protein n=1 Tax=Bacillus wiedmannii TaxID=1890302 RepID=UPI000BF80DBB|nr:hypothetical protein [Bacillus wiedmannii]PFY95268.1 hypothetical protein COL57_22790 [Bacillus wiedmannii]
MDEQKNVVSLKVHVDTKEANKRIEELTKLVNNCAAGFERLSEAMKLFKVDMQGKVNTSVCVQLDGKELAKSVDKEMAQVSSIKAKSNND